MADNGGVAGNAAQPLDGGVVNISGTGSQLFTGTFYVGKGNAATPLAVGVVNQSGGTVTVNGDSPIGYYGQGQYNLTGGTFSHVGGFINSGRQVGGFGVIDINGGTLTDTSGGARTIIGRGWHRHRQRAQRRRAER